MPDPLFVRVLGVIEGCSNPESAELLLDGETFVFGNCAMTDGVAEYREGRGVVYVDGASFISTARISGGGYVRVDRRVLIDGLTATLGCDVLRQPTDRFAAGTVFMAVGGRPISRDRKVLANGDARPHVMAFDPVSGRIVGRIPLHDASPFGRRWNGIDQCNGLALDGEGNLYVSDIATSGSASPPTPPAVYRIPHDALDALVHDDDAVASTGAAAVQRVVIPGHVNGVTCSPVDDACWAVSCSRDADPDRGAIFRLDAECFERGQQPDPVVRELGVLDGIGITRRGTLLVSNPVTGDIHVFKQIATDPSDHHVLTFDGVTVHAPADINVIYPKALGGEPGLLVPDVSMQRQPGEGVVAVLDLTGL